MTNRADVAIDDLRRIALWKLSRVLNVPPDVLQQLNEVAHAGDDLTLDSDLSQNTLKNLVKCEGVGFPMASAFLKFIRPQVFPIIDVRAYRALTGIRLRHNQYNLKIYIEYVNKLKEIATHTGKSLCEIDEQLYCFDREHNKEIDH